MSAIDAYAMLSRLAAKQAMTDLPLSENYPYVVWKRAYRQFCGFEISSNMSQASATKLIPKLRFKLNRRRKLSSPAGPQGRHDKIKKTVTALFKHERIELNYNRADESRGYAERLISDAIRYGDRHKPTMEMASYWIVESQIIHKLFKVLAPRYQNYKYSYTKLWRAPKVYPGVQFSKCILELRENIYPPLGPDKSFNKNLIHNVLLEAAKIEYHKEKALKTRSKVDNEQNNAGCGESQSSVEENVQAAEKENIDSDKESELPNKENLNANGTSKSASEEKNEEDISVENLNLSKMKITEKKTDD